MKDAHTLSAINKLDQAAGICTSLHSDDSDHRDPLSIKRVWMLRAKIERKVKRPAVAGNRTQEPGLCSQCSVTELRQPDNHQPPQSSICTAAVLQRSLSNLFGTHSQTGTQDRQTGNVLLLYTVLRGWSICNNSS